MPALAVWTSADGLLSTIAPLGLAAAAGTALVVDLDVTGPRYPSEGSLAALVREGPRRSDLEPARRGLAVLRNGGIPAPDAEDTVRALLNGWPAVVLRLQRRQQPAPVPVVPVHPLFPGALAPREEGRAVYQRTGFAAFPPGPGPVLPVPRPATVRGLLAGVISPLDRWVRAWRRVWSMPWP